MAATAQWAIVCLEALGFKAHIHGDMTHVVVRW